MTLAGKGFYLNILLQVTILWLTQLIKKLAAYECIKTRSGSYYQLQ